MKNILYLFLAVTIFACSSDGDNNSNDGCPIDFECSTATANDFLSLDDVNDEYQSFVSQYGIPISDGLYQNNDGGYYYSWVWAEHCISVSCSDCSYLIFGDCPL